MHPKNRANDEIAAIDAVFQQAPIAPPGEIAPIPDEIELPDAVGKIGIRPAPVAPPAPLRDYLRELQQEYAAQQEIGKL